jgi:hypothetical protein
MRPDELIRYYPRLYHMAEDNAWDSIRKRGLLSTASLLDLFEVPEPRRCRLLTQRRPESVPLSHPDYGRAVIRDQKPLQISKLEQLLIDMSVRDWIELLNSLVFFWVRPERVSTLLNARAYRDRPHVVLTLQTESLVHRHAEQTRLSRINTGATAYLTGMRGSTTFQKIGDFQHPRPRSLARPPRYVAELAVLTAVRDVLEHTLKVERRQGDTVLETIYVRP